MSYGSTANAGAGEEVEANLRDKSDSLEDESLKSKVSLKYLTGIDIGETDDSFDLKMEELAPYISELVGTYMIAFAYMCCQISGDDTFNPTAMACITTITIYNFGPVSGGHFNPAITLTLMKSGKIGFTEAMRYMVMQVVGGLLAGLTCSWIFLTGFIVGPTVDPPPRIKSHEGIDPETYKGLDPEYTMLDQAGVEALFTMMLCFVFANCMTSKRNNLKEDQNHFFGLAVGCVYIAAGHAAQAISGGILNPAVTMGLNLTSISQSGYLGLVYLGAQVAAGIAASYAFQWCREEDFDEMVNFSPGYVSPVQVRTVCEFLGTFWFVLTVGLNIVDRSCSTAWAALGALTSLVYALENASGAHFNPAVSFAVMLSRRNKLSFADFLQYVIAQAAGGGAAGFVFGHYKWHGRFRNNTFIVHVQEPHTWGECIVAEGMFTALVAFTLLACATATMPPSTTRTNFYFGLALGAAVASGGFAIGEITGAVMNPSLALGITSANIYSPGNGNFMPPPPGMASHSTDSVQKLLGKQTTYSHMVLGVLPDLGFINALLFCAIEMGGGAIAAAIFYITHQREYMKLSGFPVSSVASSSL